MDYKECMCKYKKYKRITLLSLGTIGVGTALYSMYKKNLQLLEDQELYEEYENENPKEDYKQRMEFYEKEFIRQDEEEAKELEEAVKQFNSKRIRREECPHCGSKKRLRNRRARKDYMNIDEENYPKGQYEDYEYLEK